MTKESEFNYTRIPTGCICPPGANLYCENPDCPRKNKKTKSNKEMEFLQENFPQ